MGIIWKAMTDKACVNCVHMSGYYCKKLKKQFKGQEIDRGLIPCEGRHFKHYMSDKPLTIHVVSPEGHIIGQKMYKGE